MTFDEVTSFPDFAAESAVFTVFVIYEQKHAKKKWNQERGPCFKSCFIQSENKSHQGWALKISGFKIARLTLW